MTMTKMDDLKYTLRLFLQRHFLIPSILIAVLLSPPWISGAHGGQMTKRFGGTAPTLDVTGTMQHVWFGMYPGDGHSGDAILYHFSGSPLDPSPSDSALRNAVFFDISDLPIGTRIIKAEYVMPYNPIMFVGNAFGIGKGISMYRILDPSGTGMWNPGNLGLTLKDGYNNIPWVEGGSFADCLDPNPVATVYDINMPTSQFYFFEMTNLVQEWVNNPGANLGVTFDASVPSDKMVDPYLRPYLQITYETNFPEPPLQASGLTVFHRSGQTFLTWKEIPYAGQFFDMHYRIYRHINPINKANLHLAQMVGEVDMNSSYNARRSEVAGVPLNYIITEGEGQLTDDNGLYVLTSKTSGSFYYAVTSVEEGNENREDFDLNNSLASPITEKPGQAMAVLQEFGKKKGGYILTFTHWADDTMSYKTGHGFNFMVNMPTAYYTSQSPVAVEVALGRRHSSYFTDYIHPSLITVRPDDYMPPTRNLPFDGYRYDDLQSWWAGCRNNYKTQTKASDGVFIPYTEKRVLFCVNFVKSRFIVDQNRIYLRGVSMGGTGAISLGIKHPEVFASITATVGSPNWRLNVNGVDKTYQVTNEGWRTDAVKLWGDFTDNVRHQNGTLIWDWMNAGWYAMNNIKQEMPFLSMNNGKKDDIIQYFPMPGFYRDMMLSRHGFSARFYNGAHGDYGSQYDPRFGTILKNESFPSFSNLSINSNPGLVHEPSGMALVADFTTSPVTFTGDSSGEINGYNCIEWSRKHLYFDSGPSDDMIDTPNRYEIAVRLENYCPVASATADITPRRLQAFIVSPLTTYYWENIQLLSGKIIQSGRATSSEHGLITIPSFIIERSVLGNKLVITPLSTISSVRNSYSAASQTDPSTSRRRNKSR